MPTVLHFADAHIDMANYGRHDPQTGLPVRVMDFLASLDVIIDTAIKERVDLVLFAGDAYKDRNPAPTFQREWGRRIMRLSRAEIPTLLLVGNHDLSPALGRAHALESFDTLEVPHVQVIEKPCLLKSNDIEGINLQVIAIPWISRSGLISSLGLQADDPAQIYDRMSELLADLVDEWLSRQVDPDLPTILAAHCSIEGAQYGGERMVMLGSDLVLPPSLVKDSRLDYVALGHIHKFQDLNIGNKPPVVYAGSIERVDFGEAQDDKGFVIAHVERGKTEYEWRKLTGIRQFIDRHVRLESNEGVLDQIFQALPPAEKIANAIVRLVLEYPRDWEALIDEAAIREFTSSSFEFHLVKRPQIESRVRIPDDQSVGSLSSLELLEIYLKASHEDPQEFDSLKSLAEQVIQAVEGS